MRQEHCTVHPLPMEHALVYSFHMPLFFLIAGYLAKEVHSFADFGKTTKKNIRRLLLPFAITYALSYLWASVQQSAQPVHVGSLWFLVALFWVREVYVYLQILTRKMFTKNKE